jgi:hypothetical protein
MWNGRRARWTVATALAGAVALAVSGAGVAAGAGKRQSGTNVFTTQKRGAATGNLFHFAFVNPENPAQKPHTVNRIVAHAPAGTVYDFGAVPQCHASDAELQTLGAAACPADSKVGSGLAVSDTGSSGPFPPRYTESAISQFNGDHELIGVGENKDIPVIKTVTHTKFTGTTASTDFPTFPGMPPPDSYTPLKTLDVDFAKGVRNGRATTRTPATCPSVGYWTFVTDFTYVDGVTQHVVSRSPCQKAPAKPPKKHHHKGSKHPGFHHPEGCRDQDEPGDCD